MFYERLFHEGGVEIGSGRRLHQLLLVVDAATC